MFKFTIFITFEYCWTTCPQSLSFHSKQELNSLPLLSTHREATRISWLRTRVPGEGKEPHVKIWPRGFASIFLCWKREPLLLDHTFRGTDKRRQKPGQSQWPNQHPKWPSHLRVSFRKPQQLTPCLLFRCQVESDSLRSHELQHVRLSCPSISPGVCSNSCPLSWWCPSTISSSSPPSLSAFNLSQL